MKYYKIKVGNLYVDHIWTRDDAIKTDFISEVRLRPDDIDLEITEDEMKFYAAKLSTVLNIDIEKITFEEIIKDDTK